MRYRFHCFCSPAAQPLNVSITGRSDFPIAVKLYSTRGGISWNCLRSIKPSEVSSRRLWLSIMSVISGTSRLISPYLRPDFVDNAHKIRSFHFPPMREMANASGSTSGVVWGRGSGIGFSSFFTEELCFFSFFSFFSFLSFFITSSPLAVPKNKRENYHSHLSLKKR